MRFEGIKNVDDMNYLKHGTIPFLEISSTDGIITHARIKLNYLEEPKGFEDFLKKEAENLIDLTLIVEEFSDQLLSLSKIVSKVSLPALTHLTIAQEEMNLIYDEMPRAALSSKASDELLKALPNLESLYIKGNGVFGELNHPNIKSLYLEGFSVTQSFSKKKADIPALESLKWSFTADGHGVCITPNWFRSLFAADGLPALKKLDFGETEMDESLLSNNFFLKGGLLAQLEELVLPWLIIEDLKKAAKWISNLKKLVVVDDEHEELKSAAPEGILSFVESSQKSSFEIVKNRESMIYEVTGKINDDNAAQLTEVFNNHQEREQIDKLHFHLINGFHRGYDLTASGFEVLAPALASLPNLKYLSLEKPGYKKGVDGKGMKMLRKAFTNHPALKTLNLWQNPMGSEAIIEVAQLLQNSCLENLDISMSKQPIDSNALNYLSESIAKSKTIKYIDLDRLKCSNISAVEMGTKLGEAIAANNSLKQLHLTRLNLGPEGLIEFSKGLKQNHTLEALFLSGNHMGADGLMAIAEVVKTHPNLRFISLGNDNDLSGNEAGNALKQLLTTTQLNRFEFNAYECDFSENDTIQFINSINESSLKQLELDCIKYANFKGKLAVEAAREWSNHNTLQTLIGFKPDEITEEECDQIAKSLADMPNLIHTEHLGFSLHIKVIQHSKKLQVVSEQFRNNKYLIPFLKAVEDSPSIHSVDIHGIDMDKTDEKALFSLIEKSKTLKELNVRYCLNVKSIVPLLQKVSKQKVLQHLSIIDRDLPLGLVKILRGHPERWGLELID